MKKFIFGSILGLVLVGGVVFASVPGDSSITMATGTAQAPASVHNIVLPATTSDLGTKQQGTNDHFLNLPVSNIGNVSDSVKGTVLSSSGVTITSAKFEVSNTDTQVVTPGTGNFWFKVQYNVNPIAPGSPNAPISIEVKFEVL